MELDRKELTGAIISCGIEVHRQLGPGFLESLYHSALLLELKRQGLKAESQKEVRIYYLGQEIGTHRLDMVVNDAVVVELKTVSEFNDVHLAQVLSYLKATGLKVGLLMNFAQSVLKVKRVVGK
ncbi:MAG: GxxExxY protein [Rhodocyclaceae bacterium]|nr:GxxExxY protein [Rhodocyclaceae bacterium]